MSMLAERRRKAAQPGVEGGFESKLEVEHFIIEMMSFVVLVETLKLL